MFGRGYLQCRLVPCVVCKLFAMECWSICTDLKPGALRVCKDRWLRNTTVCKPEGSCSQATTPNGGRGTKYKQR
jgi:hypothetical protein